MSIVDKLTPPPPPPEVGSVTALSPDANTVILAMIAALNDIGLKITPDQVKAKIPAPVPPPVPTLPAPLTESESELLDRSVTFIKRALNANGISPTLPELRMIGAAVADFVTREEARSTGPTTAAPVEPATPPPVATT